jgi:acyl-CoA reductase-like NAD-dependent aldehyde dehydrogenase
VSLKVVNPYNQEIVCELSHDEGARLDQKVDTARHANEKRGRTATSFRRPYRPTFPITPR